MFTAPVSHCSKPDTIVTVEELGLSADCSVSLLPPHGVKKENDFDAIFKTGTEVKDEPWKTKILLIM